MAEEKFEDKTLRKQEEIKIKEGEEKEKKEEKAAAKKEEKKAPAAKKDEGKEGKEEKKIEIVLERKYMVNLSRAYAKPKTKRDNTAITMLKKFAVRHMKGKSASIEPKLNDTIRATGKPAKKVSVLLQKDKEGVVYAKLAQ